MRESTIILGFQEISARLQRAEYNISLLQEQINGLIGAFNEIIGKGLMHQHAVNKVLMDKGLFNDGEVKTALEFLVSEAKATVEKRQAENKAKEEAAKNPPPAMTPDGQADTNTPGVKPEENETKPTPEV